MKSKRAFLFRALTVLVLILISVAMFILGRGHTVYLDNKSGEYEGTTYEAPYKMTVYVDGEQVAKLYEKERGQSGCIGQSFNMTLEIMQEKNGSETTQSISVRLPYNMDGIVINVPALMAGLPEDAYLSEFVSLLADTEPVEDEVIIDEFGLLEPVE